MFSKRPKFGNTKVVYDGIKFDSKRERDRYIVLMDAQRQGIISNLRLQVPYTLLADEYTDFVKQLKTKTKIERRRTFIGVKYKADFVYLKDGVTIVEDCKISPRMIPKEYVLKEKMMHSLKGIDIRRVYKANDPI